MREGGVEIAVAIDYTINVHCIIVVSCFIGRFPFAKLVVQAFLEELICLVLQRFLPYDSCLIRMPRNYKKLKYIKIKRGIGCMSHLHTFGRIGL